MSDDDESAKRFTERLSEAGREHRQLDTLAADVEGFSLALDRTPQALGDALQAAGAAPGGPAAVRDAAFASAACDRAGRVVAADAAFRAWLIGPEPLRDAVRHLQADQPRLSVIVDDADGRPIAVAVARAVSAAAWPLAEEVRAALESGGAAVAVLAVRPAAAAWAEVAQVFGFTGLETRLTRALIDQGDLRRAASAAGVGYETAREALAGAMAKTGAHRQAELVRQLTRLAIGDLSAVQDGWRVLADMFDLTARQARLAWAIAQGATRAEAAQALGVSEHAAKTDLRAVYAACGVDAAADLGRLAAEVEALSALAAAIDIQWTRASAAGAPLRFVRRRAPGRIAVEDHGPADAAPVVVIHTPTNGRHLPRRLVASLQAVGLRPISIERPGYGLTTPMPAGSDVFEDAMADMIDVLDALGLERVRILGRGCAIAMAFGARHPERFERGVLLGPFAPDQRQWRRDGLMGAVATMLLDRPQLMAAFGAMLARGATREGIAKVTRAITRNSPADQAALADPQVLGDYVRSAQQAAIGGLGILREVPVFAPSGGRIHAQDGRPWVIVIGGQDAMQKIADPATAWEPILPGARVLALPGAGRFPHMSHPDEIAAALV